MEGNANCSVHGDRKIEYLCLDPLCSESAKACVLCVKRSHKNCAAETLIYRRGPLTVRCPESESAARFGDVWRARVGPLAERLRRQLETLVGEPASVFSGAQKCMFSIAQEPASQKITVTPKQFSEEDFKEAQKAFESVVSGISESTVDSLTKLCLRSKTPFEISDFHVNAGLELTLSGPGFRLLNVAENEGYEGMVLLKPLPTQCTVNIRVLRVCEAQRYLEMGVMTEAEFKEEPRRSAFFEGSAKYCYWGYGASGLAAPDFKDVDPESEKGLTENTNVTLTVDRAQRKISCKVRNSYTLEAADVPDCPYYLYFVLRSQEDCLTFSFA